MEQGVLLVVFLGSIAISLSSPGRPYGSPDNGYEESPRNRRPNIIVILADDMGWNDVSFHGSDQIPTPNIDALAYNGVILNSHYVPALCTPSRAALMTGKYPIHLGMQHSVILEPEPRGLPLSEKLLPEYLKEAGYRTHAIGKWHLGYHRREYTPTYRGFDSHFGYWNGLQDYYSHVVEATFAGYRGFDMRRNTSVAWDTAGKYSTDLFTEEAVSLIDHHDPKDPLFLYMAHLAPHSGNQDEPFQAPDEAIARFGHIRDPERRIYAAMVSKLDDSVGEVVSALRRRGMLENSVVLFMTDNGAPTMGIHSNRGSNYPLRGIKESAWEGGVRGVAAIWSPLIRKSRRVSNQLIYVTDWLPTLLSAAGLDKKGLGNIDGVDVWPALVSDKVSPRSEAVVNIDEIDDYSAIRRGDFKYILGSTKTGEEWYGEAGRADRSQSEGTSPGYKPEEILGSKVGVAISGVITAKQVLEVRKLREAKVSSGELNARMLTTSDILRMRSEAELKCNTKEEEKVSCDPLDSPCLFNIREDPCEMVNLAKTKPVILATLEDALLKYKVTMVPPSNLDKDPLANPANWNGTWVNWHDQDPMEFLRELKSSSRLSGTTIAILGILLGLLFLGVVILIAVRRLGEHKQEPHPEDGSFHEVLEDPVGQREPLGTGQRATRLSGSLGEFSRLNDVPKTVD
ncbi:arylsulfatase B [Orussus abietinus]|uniref:arylsulfatase B n=1 Tax=Orussus abietinus TaxID=222816 RepID=UPI00062598A2|nr:arylsulfatase B [Orussus abietinus]